jgi:phage-related protein
MAAAGKVAATAAKAIVGAFAAVGGAMLGVAEKTRDFRTEQTQLTTAFEMAGGTAEQATKTFEDLYGVLGDSGKATEAAQHLSQLTTDEKALAEYTNILTGVYAELGDSIPTEGLAEAINHTAKMGEVQGTLADALEWAGVNLDDFNAMLFECNSEAEREALIRDTLNGLYGESGNAYKENAKDIIAANKAQLALTKGMADLGAAVEPIITVFKTGLANAIQNIVPHFQELTEGLTDVINGVEGGQAKMSNAIYNIITSILDTITDALPVVLQMGLDIITALIEGINAATPTILQTIVDLLPQVISTLGELIPMITGTILDSLPMLIEAIFQLVAQILVELGNILPEIVMQIIEIVPMLIDAILDNIPVLFNAAVTFLMAIVDALPTLIMALLDSLPTIIDSILDFFMNNYPLMIEGAFQLFMGIVKAIPEIIPALISKLGEIVVKIRDSLGEKLPTVFKNIWSSFTKGAKDAFNGFKDIFGKIPDWFKNTFGTAWQKIKDIFSKGGQIFDGIKDGILEGLKNVVNAIIRGINKVISIPFKGIKDALDGIRGVDILGVKPFEWLPTISVPKIPELEKGGVLERGQVGLLEGNGAEAVVPLERNTKWLDKLANMLTEKLSNSEFAGGSEQPIVLQVDGRVLARTSIKSINQLTRQTGKLGLLLE